MRTADLFKFIRERHRIYVTKQAGKPKPWTQDKILQTYRFCNVYRELDTTTQWIAKNWRYPYRKERHLWFAMVVARFINWPATLALLEFPIPFNSFDIRRIALGGLRRKVFSSAYIVSTHGIRMKKLPYLLKHVFAPLWKEREDIADVIHSTTMLSIAHRSLMQFDGLGSFMAAQVVADLKYVLPLSKARDWHTWAASGPGSRRGLNRVFGYAVDSPWGEESWAAGLYELYVPITKLVNQAKLPPLHAQDLQNCLCEFDKYERTRLGEGRPRQLYPGI